MISLQYKLNFESMKPNFPPQLLSDSTITVKLNHTVHTMGTLVSDHDVAGDDDACHDVAGGDADHDVAGGGDAYHDVAGGDAYHDVAGGGVDHDVAGGGVDVAGGGVDHDVAGGVLYILYHAQSTIYCGERS